MSDPSAVEAAIRRAQLAILNPSVDYKKFENYKLPKEPEKLPLGSKKQLSFSKNVVCLEISGPNVTDLTLIDLPGLIKNIGEGEDPNSIAIIEDLVKEYIKKDCLILLTITMLGEQLRAGRLPESDSYLYVQTISITNLRLCSRKSLTKKANEPSVR